MIATTVRGKKSEFPIVIIHDSILALWWENNYYLFASFIFQLLVVIALDGELM